MFISPRSTDLLRRAVFLLGGKVGIWKQAWELVIIKNLNPQHPSSCLPADKVTQGDIPLGLMQTSLRSRLSQIPYGRDIKDERIIWTRHQRRKNKNKNWKPFSRRHKISNRGRGLHPRHAPRPTALESQHRLKQLTQHATHESKTK
jgi:hypothetical protein